MSPGRQENASRREVGIRRLAAGSKPALERQRGRAGFTLVEMILVMSLLVIVISVAAPSLVNFFKSRSLDSEARRFVALTRYGQSRAAAEGAPMLLWLDPRQRVYGLEAELGGNENDRKAAEFTLAQNLEVEVIPTAQQPRQTQLRQTVSRQVGAGRPVIRFQPDGYISDTSPERLLFTEGGRDQVWVGLNADRQHYEIQTNNLPYRIR